MGQIRGAWYLLRHHYRGSLELNGANHEIIPDRIVSGTYLIIAAATAEDVQLKILFPITLGHFQTGRNGS